LFWDFRLTQFFYATIFHHRVFHTQVSSTRCASQLISLCWPDRVQIHKTRVILAEVVLI